MKKIRENLTLIAALSWLADLVTTKIGFDYPELTEMHPWALKIPIFEGVLAIGLPPLLLKVGDGLKVDPNVTTVCALGPAILPSVAATNNAILIAQAHAKLYPWNECPFLYPE